MPSFTTSVTDLEFVGPIIDLTIAMAGAAEQALVRAGEAVPSPIQIGAMVDTGASQTVIQHGIADQLKLQPIGVTTISTPSSTDMPCPVFAVRLLLPETVGIDMPVIEAPLQGQNIQGLIGRDLLKYGVLVYIGYKNQFTLSF